MHNFDRLQQDQPHELVVNENNQHIDLLPADTIHFYQVLLKNYLPAVDGLN
jgi:hypothetical protein